MDNKEFEKRGMAVHDAIKDLKPREQIMILEVVKATTAAMTIQKA